MITRKKLLVSLSTHFRLMDTDLLEMTDNGKQKKWLNLCDFSRDRLAEKGYLYRPGFMDREIKIVAGSWVSTPQGNKEADQIKKYFGDAAITRLIELAEPIKRANDDLFFDLF